MRILAALPLLLTACDTFPVTVDPRLQVSPYLAAYQLRGDMSMQSNNGMGPVNNAPQSLRQFGFDNYEDDVGVRANLGDGFAGLSLDYYRLDMNTSRTGQLTDDFGNLRQGEFVRMSATMDEWRFGWMNEVFRHRGEFRADELDLRLGLGAVYAQRKLLMRTQTDDPSVTPERRQNVEITGDAIYPAVRFRANWRSLSLNVDYAISPELQFGGDYDGTQQDFETWLSYAVPYQDVSLFAGFRYSVLEGNGSSSGLEYQADLRLDGFQFGMSVHF